jgi:hypothetical protein
MRTTNSESEQIDWRNMENRLRKVEDALISVQTIVNLLMDLLERAIPQRDVDGDAGDDEEIPGGNDEI